LLRREFTIQRGVLSRSSAYGWVEEQVENQMKVGAQSWAGTLRVLWSCILAMAIFAGTAPFALGQAFDTGTINGTVTDSSGAVVAHASVLITNIGTANQQTVETDGNGAFVASALPYGEYVVEVTAPGFAKTKSQAITLNVGATVNVNLSLSIAAGTESVVITGTSTTVDTSSATTGTTLDANQIENLPVNGRDVSSFLEIAPGSIGSTGFFQGSVNGLENIFTGLNIKLDGQNASRGDINGFLDTEGGEQARVTRASLDSIQEIQFANNGYSSENGFSLGPQMNIITKSGTNEFHGSVFEFLRNDALDAKDFFQAPGLPTSPLRLNQFGANLAGPIYRNKLFFFVNYEGVRQKITSINALNETLSAFARSQIVASVEPILGQLAPLPTGCTAIPAPASCAVPGSGAGNSAAQGANLVFSPAVLPTSLREDTGSVRIDYTISDKDRLSFRYNINDSITQQTYGPNAGQIAPQKLRTQLAKVDETHTFSPTFVNQFSVGLNRFYSDTNSDTPTPLVGFAGFFTNLGSLPGPNTFNQITPFSVFEVFDNATKTIGNHTLKFGEQIRVNRLNEALRPQQTFDFASFSDLENNRPFVLQKIGFDGGVGIRNSNWDWYVQDDWKITRRLTVNFGLRYEYNTVWREGHNRIQNFDVATQAFLSPDQAPYNSPKNEFAPRIGLAYDPFGRGKTVIHAYGGIFYMPMQFGFGLTSNIPALASYNVNVFQVAIAYPMANPPLPAGTQNVSTFPQHPRDPYSTNWLLGIEQQVAPNTLLTVNYTGNKTQHMQSGISFASLNANPANVLTQARPFGGFANENLDSDALSSNYNAMQVQLRRRAGRLTLEANYTWSHEIDDLVNVFSGFSDPFNPAIDRSSGDWDVRNNFTASAIYTLPLLSNSNAVVRNVFGGWQTSTIVQTRSGLPVNVSLESGFFGLPMRPNAVSGQSLFLSGVGFPNAKFNPAAFAIEPGFNGAWGDVIGTVGRNTLRGPGFFQADFSLMKDFAVHEKMKLQFRVDLFNIFNHPNFGPPDGGLCTAVSGPTATLPAQCTINTNFGRVGGTIADTNGSQIGTGTARQAQFSLKFTF
jgi:Carboxypeptidase regulatory-like domain/TonB dependent receptor